MTGLEYLVVIATLLFLTWVALILIIIVSILEDY